jgi:hypothetical protein
MWAMFFGLNHSSCFERNRQEKTPRVCGKRRHDFEFAVWQPDAADSARGETELLSECLLEIQTWSIGNA